MLPPLLYLEKPQEAEHRKFLSDDAYTDLNVSALDAAMGGEDAFMRAASERTLRMFPARSPEEARFRQRIVRDVIGNAEAVEAVYRVAKAAIEDYDRSHRLNQPAYARFESMAIRLRSAAELLTITLSAAGEIAARLGNRSFASDGLARYASAFRRFYGAAFLNEAKEIIEGINTISAGSRLTVSAVFGQGLKGAKYIIRKIEPQAPPDKRARADKATIPLDTNRVMSQALGMHDAALTYLYRIAQAAGERAYAQLKDFAFALGFYLGCARLHETLARIGVPTCDPDPLAFDQRRLQYDDLADCSLALQNGTHPVGNAADYPAARLCVVTGANQGGKSTYLRSIGLAYVMMSAGMFVCARSFSAGISSGVFTHFCRAEDERMRSGKLDEELIRMSAIIDQLTPGALILMNESFASTTEGEGSAIAAEVTTVLYDLNIRAFYVTHLYEYARTMAERALPGAVFLTAGRNADGSRSFVVKEGVPEPSSHGLDLYLSIVDNPR